MEFCVGNLDCITSLKIAYYSLLVLWFYNLYISEKSGEPTGHQG